MIDTARGTIVTLEILKGNEARCAVAFTRTSDGVGVDPAVVLFKYEDPSGNLTTLTYGVDAALVKDSTGNYHVDIDGDESVIWLCKWIGTGDNQAVGQASFAVTEPDL